MQEAGLDPKGFFLLSMVEHHPYPSDLSRALVLPQPTISHMTKRLEEGGFLRRAVEPDDLRRYRFTLTDTAKSAMQAARTCLEETVAEMTTCLEAEELAFLESILSRLPTATDLDSA